MKLLRQARSHHVLLTAALALFVVTRVVALTAFPALPVCVRSGSQI